MQLEDYNRKVFAMLSHAYNWFDLGFLNEYQEKEVPFGPLGYITFKRTYAREITNEGRKEEWFETCARVISGNFLLEAQRYNTLSDDGMGYYNELERLQSEAKQAYDDMFHLRWTPAGRGLWVSGTETGLKHGASLTNCYYVDVCPYEDDVTVPFCFAMDMLMLGAGVGFGVYSENTGKIPKVANHVDLFIVCDKDHPDFKDMEVHEADSFKLYDSHNYRQIQDSREGWVYGLKKVIESHFLSKRGSKKAVVVDVSAVRPSGSRINGFGGTASGPTPLVELLRYVNSLLNRSVGSNLTGVDCTDIMCAIGRCVVAGNVRRSAMIALGDFDDAEFVNMKNPDGSLEKDDLITRHRWASNNSVLFDPSMDINSFSNSVFVKGEPGWLNMDLTRNYGRLNDLINYSDLKVRGTNPCGEISLESFEPCNLVEVFPFNCEDYEELERVTLTAYRYAKRVTMSNYAWEQTREVVERNRRIGVSLSGIQDWLLKVYQEKRERFNGHTSCLEDAELTILGMMDRLYKKLKEEDKEFSRRLQIPESIKLTTVKPSGTVSKLPGLSPGIHYHTSAYMIRRIQFQKNNPMVQYLKDLGFTVRDAATTPNAVVVEFPTKAPTAEMEGFRSGCEVSAKEQLEFQYQVQSCWADNQVSCTISLQESDRSLLPSLVEEYGPLLKSTSFLPYSPDLKTHYVDLPEEPITQEQYEALMSKIVSWPCRIENDLYEQDENIENSSDCIGGSCPVR